MVLSWVFHQGFTQQNENCFADADLTRVASDTVPTSGVWVAKIIKHRCRRPPQRRPSSTLCWRKPLDETPWEPRSYRMLQDCRASRNHIWSKVPKEKKIAVIKAIRAITGLTVSRLAQIAMPQRSQWYNTKTYKNNQTYNIHAAILTPR